MMQSDAVRVPAFCLFDTCVLCSAASGFKGAVCANCKLFSRAYAVEWPGLCFVGVSVHGGAPEVAAETCFEPVLFTCEIALFVQLREANHGAFGLVAGNDSVKARLLRRKSAHVWPTACSLYGLRSPCPSS